MVPAGVAWPFRPTPLVRLPCGSTSTSRTRLLREGERCREVDGGGGFTDAALLIGDREDAPHLCYMP